MLLFKNIFLNILFMVEACVLVTCVNPPQDYTDCINAMKSAFDGEKSPLKCVQHAIRNFKLLGTSSDCDKLHENVISYIRVLSEASTAESILDMTTFCEKLAPVILQMKLSHNSNGNSASSSNTASTVPNILNEIDECESTIYNMSGNTKEVTLFNAIHHHKQHPTISSISQHKRGSYGYCFLEHIADHVQITRGDTDDPVKYCKRIHGLLGEGVNVVDEENVEEGDDEE